mmetsp:Transcript_34488/g.109212  ORF Transcript_34488/g.109212 Transcript_34488/m.109212 type:complete len:111 (+) Transcript_34488:675-1007(+)
MLRSGLPLPGPPPGELGRRQAALGLGDVGRDACGVAGRRLSDRILVIGGERDALAPEGFLEDLADAFCAGDPILFEGCGHSVSLDSRWHQDIISTILDWTRLLFVCGYVT